MIPYDWLFKVQTVFVHVLYYFMHVTIYKKTTSRSHLLWNFTSRLNFIYCKTNYRYYNGRLYFMNYPRWTGSQRLIFATKRYPHFFSLCCNNYIVDTGSAARNIRDNKAHTNLMKISRTQIKVFTISLKIQHIVLVWCFLFY